MKAIWQSFRGICPECGCKPALNPLRALIGAVLVITVLTACMAFMDFAGKVQLDGITERMNAHVAQDAK